MTACAVYICMRIWRICDYVLLLPSSNYRECCTVGSDQNAAQNASVWWMWLTILQWNIHTPKLKFDQRQLWNHLSCWWVVHLIISMSYANIPFPLKHMNFPLNPMRSKTHSFYPNQTTILWISHWAHWNPIKTHEQSPENPIQILTRTRFFWMPDGLVPPLWPPVWFRAASRCRSCPGTATLADSSMDIMCLKHSSLSLPPNHHQPPDSFCFISLHTFANDYSG